MLRGDGRRAAERSSARPRRPVHGRPGPPGPGMAPGARRHKSFIGFRPAGRRLAGKACLGRAYKARPAAEGRKRRPAGRKPCAAFGRAGYNLMQLRPGYKPGLNCIRLYIFLFSLVLRLTRLFSPHNLDVQAWHRLRFCLPLLQVGQMY